MVLALEVAGEWCTHHAADKGGRQCGVILSLRGIENNKERESKMMGLMKIVNGVFFFCLGLDLNKIHSKYWME